MRYRVDLTEPAEQDADEIYAWLHRRSPDGAGRWWKALLTALEKLKENASILSLAPEASRFDEPVRQVLFKTQHGRTYRAIFVLRDDVVHVLRVRGGGEDIVGRDDMQIPG